MRAAGLTPDAPLGMAAFAAATWTTTLLQMVLVHRCLHRNVPAGPRRYDFAAWLKTSGPMFAVWAFYMLLTYTDVLVLRQFQPPEVVAHYYAAAKTLALVAFIHFAVSAAVAHRFAAHHVAGDRDALAKLAASTVRWTFWPSLLAIAGVLALGKPILWLFGPSFGDAYPLMFILAIPLVARAAVGPGRAGAQHAGRAAPLRAGLWRDVRAQSRRIARGGRPLRQHRRRLRDRGRRRDRSGVAVPDRQAPARPAHADLAVVRNA